MSTDTRELLAALTALRNGDFSVRLSVGGETGSNDAEIARVFNELGEMLSTYGSEVQRVSRELGTEGRFGPQAEVAGVEGEWRTTLEEFNRMAAHLTDQVRDLAQVTTAIAKGNFARKVTVGAEGEMRELKQTINVMIDQCNVFAYELTRVSREVGTEGILGGQIEVVGASGTWEDLITNVNRMVENLTIFVRGLSQYSNAVATGDSSKALTFMAAGKVLDLPTKGEMALLCEIIQKNAGTYSRFVNA